MLIKIFKSNFHKLTEKAKKKKDTALFSPEQEVHSLAKKHTERSNLDPSLASIRNRQSSIFSSSGHG